MPLFFCSASLSCSGRDSCYLAELVVSRETRLTAPGYLGIFLAESGGEKNFFKKTIFGVFLDQNKDFLSRIFFHPRRPLEAPPGHLGKFCPSSETVDMAGNVT